MEKKESIQVIREQLKLGPEEAELERWRKDGRTGVRKLLEAYDRKQAARKLERERLERLQDLEREFWERGMDQVAGCDEAGRGPLAGPLVTAAVILPHGIWLPGLTDSKKVTPARRETLYGEILEQAVSVTVSILGPREIDRLNIYQAAKTAMTLCLTHMKVHPQGAITDAMPLEIPGIPVEDMVRGGQQKVQRWRPLPSSPRSQGTISWKTWTGTIPSTDLPNTRDTVPPGTSRPSWTAAPAPGTGEASNL